MYCTFLFQVSGEGSELQFTVYHKHMHVTESEFHEMRVRNNRTVTLQDVLLGEEYEVLVSSVEVSTGKISPLSRGLAIGEKDVTLTAILNVYVNEHSVKTCVCMSAYICMCLFICV